MPQILLAEPDITGVSLEDAMRKRASFPPENGPRLKDLRVEDVSNLFGMSLKAREGGARPYPSGGGKYPMETYFIGTLGDSGCLARISLQPDQPCALRPLADAGKNFHGGYLPASKCRRPGMYRLHRHVGTQWDEVRRFRLLPRHARSGSYGSEYLSRRGGTRYGRTGDGRF